MNVVQTLLTPFHFSFMRDAFAVSLMVSVPTALLSCFIILKGWALMGDAISHAVFPGVVISYIVGLPYIVGAFVAGIICGLASGALHENSRIKQDTAMGIVFAGMFGFGLVLFTKIQSTVHLEHILFGNMLGVGSAEIVQVALIALCTTSIIAIKWRDLLLHSFDPTHAMALGLPSKLLHFGLLAMLSLTIVGAMSAVGIILVVAVLVAPGAIAFLWTRKFSSMLLLSVAIATTSSFFGTYLSFFLDSSPSATIALLLAACFIITLRIAVRTVSLPKSEN